MEASAAFRKTHWITGSLIGVVMSFERRGVVEQIGCFPVKGIAAQHESNRMMRLQIEILREGLPSGKPLPRPSLERIFGRLKIEEREPVRSVSYESL
jgi:hypothetical protein